MFIVRYQIEAGAVERRTGAKRLIHFPLTGPSVEISRFAVSCSLLLTAPEV
jgi:hypothetical protein